MNASTQQKNMSRSLNQFFDRWVNMNRQQNDDIDDSYFRDNQNDIVADQYNSTYKTNSKHNFNLNDDFHRGKAFNAKKKSTRSTPITDVYEDEDEDEHEDLYEEDLYEDDLYEDEYWDYDDIERQAGFIKSYEDEMSGKYVCINCKKTPMQCKCYM